MARGKLPPGLTADDYEISATVRDLPGLERVLEEVRRRRPERDSRRLLDLGCGIGGLTLYIAQQLGAKDAIGVDVDESRLRRAADRGVRTINADLNTDTLPVEDASIDLVVSFGAFEHLVWYDTAVSEASRVLANGGHFLLAMPNLGSYVNRVALLLGYQPREVEVSKVVSAGLMSSYHRAPSRGEPLGHVHAATLRCMKQLLGHFRLRTVAISGSSPDFGSRTLRTLDRIFGRFPSLSRRFIILAEKQGSHQGG
ncbi:MAG TPA: class I SAM-dependent methyltransferase [Actinomycetota bacterium]|jgi:ubiquinone/menaquinone biosynthesis C-methylase UbiE